MREEAAGLGGRAGDELRSPEAPQGRAGGKGDRARRGDSHNLGRM